MLRGTKWLECEFTIVGGPYDKRRFWQNIMLMVVRLILKLVCLGVKKLVLEPLEILLIVHLVLIQMTHHQSAMNRRKVNDLTALDGAEFCLKVAIEKGTNGYADKNKMLVPLAVNSNEYIGSTGQAPVQPKYNTHLNNNHKVKW